MGFLERIGLREEKTADINEVLRDREGLVETATYLQERLAELELSLEDVGWQQLGWQSEHEFSREGLRRICALSRLAFLEKVNVSKLSWALWRRKGSNLHNRWSAPVLCHLSYVPKFGGSDGCARPLRLR